MPARRIVHLMPRPGHGPRRLALAASVAAAATVIACLAAGSASGAPAAPGHPARAGTADSADTAAMKPGTVSCGPPDYFIQCYSPGQYQVAYGVAPLLRGGITGSGETVVMPELANHPGPDFTDIRQDLAAFDRKFGLPAAKLTVTTTLAGSRAPYVAGTEEVEDTEIVHAIAPGAALDVVLVPLDASASAANFTAAVTGVIHAAIAQNAAVVSISASEGERLLTPAEVTSLHAALRQAAGRRVTVVASSGTPARSATTARPSRSACPPPTRWCSAPAAPP
jgi:subtilase family serine protease